MPRIEIILSPELYESRSLRSGFIPVVVDVLRATTAFCAAFDAGAECILPLAGLDRLKDLRNEGYLLVAERDGLKVDFADYGNSPTLFLKENLRGKRLAYSTTNGTRAIECVKENGSVTVAAFVNLAAIASFLSRHNRDVLILCSGWKNSFSLEDTVCAGSLATRMTEHGLFSPEGDATVAAMQLWDIARSDIREFCSQGDHFKRLLKLGLLEDLEHCFQPDTSSFIPVWDGEKFIQGTYQESID